MNLVRIRKETYSFRLRVVNFVHKLEKSMTTLAKKKFGKLLHKSQKNIVLQNSCQTFFKTEKRTVGLCFMLKILLCPVLPAIQEKLS